MRRKLVFTLLLILAAAVTLSASPRFFLGASVNYDVNMLAPSLQKNFDSLQGIYNNGDVSSLQGIGPKIEVAFFPFSSVPIGLGVSSTTLFTLGWNGEGYKNNPSDDWTTFSRNLDFREDLGVSLCYQQRLGSSWGIFADLGFMYSWFRVATSNNPNSKDEVEYIRFTNYGLSANLGAYLENHGSFFKVGAVLYYDLANASEKAFRYGMTLGGGFSFG